MENNVVKSISYLEFVNKLTAFVNNLLYSPDSGYLYWSSKEAVLNFEDIIKRFDLEASKLAKNIDVSDIDSVINSKKHLLILAMQKHYEKQVMVWADEVFDELVDNCLFELSLNKEKSQELYKSIISSVNWLCDVKNLDKDDYQALLNNLTSRFDKVLKTQEDEYIPKNVVKKSDKKEFCKLWNLALENSDEFLNEDFNQYSNKLSIEDIKYFENLKFKLQNYKKTTTLDELALISSTIDTFEISRDEDKYDFIYDIKNDFIDFLEQNKTLDENEKVTLLKRRAQLFSAKNKKEYFKKLITS